MKTFFALFLLVYSLSANAQDRLTVGIKAPNITVTDVLGNKIVLKTIEKKQKILLVFFRYAWCPICNLRTHELIERYQELKAKGYEVLAFYQSPTDKLKEYAEDKKIPFPIISDTDGKYYKLYKLEYNKKKLEESFKNPKTLALFDKAEKISDYETDKKKYEVAEEPAANLIPADFVIDKKGYIERAYYGMFFGDHLPLTELK